MKLTSRNLQFLRSAIVGSVIYSASAPALAQTAEELDLEIFIVDEDATPADVINRIALPTPAATEIPTPVVNESLQQLESNTDATLDSATRTVTETINDAISSGDITKLPPEVDDLVPDEVIDKIIESTGLDVDLGTDVGATLDSTVDALPGTPPDLPVHIDDVDSAIDQLEINTPEVVLPEVDQTIESLRLPDALPADDADINTTVDDAIQAVEESTEEATQAGDNLLPDLLNP